MWNYKNKNHLYTKKPKKTIFGGNVKSQSEIRDLSTKIKEQEEKDFQEFHKEFEQKASSIWNEDAEGVSESIIESEPSSEEKKELSVREKLLILSQLQLNLKKIMQTK